MNIKITCIIIALSFIITSCNKDENTSDMDIIFLHHSTGEYIWDGKPPSLLKRGIRKFSKRLSDYIFNRNSYLPTLISDYNKEHDKNYLIKELDFPKNEPYGWNNFPYDYYNIWVLNAGEEPFKEEPTLEILTKDYQLIIFKHCYPVSNIKPAQDSSDIKSWIPTISNYKLQYSAIRDKLHDFPETKFIIFTGAVQVEANLPEDEAKRAKAFFTWVKKEWDIPDDNIFIWDLYNLQTEEGLYLKNEYAMSSTDSHPNKEFSARASKLLFNRIIDVIESNGNRTYLTGELK